MLLPGPSLLLFSAHHHKHMALILHHITYINCWTYSSLLNNVDLKTFTERVHLSFAPSPHRINIVGCIGWPEAEGGLTFVLDILSSISLAYITLKSMSPRLELFRASLSSRRLSSETTKQSSSSSIVTDDHTHHTREGTPSPTDELMEDPVKEKLRTDLNTR